jgi:hypothetical protein
MLRIPPVFWGGKRYEILISLPEYIEAILAASIFGVLNNAEQVNPDIPELYMPRNADGIRVLGWYFVYEDCGIK